MTEARTDFLRSPPQRADGATLACIYAVALTVIPSREVIRALPLSITPAQVIGLVALLCWLCAQFSTSLGVAKGRTGVRVAIFAYVASVLATYGYATYGYLPADELNLADHSVVLVAGLMGISVAMCDGVRGRDRLDLVLQYVVTGAAFVAFVGAAQFLLHLDLTQYLAFPGLRETADLPDAEVRNGVIRVAGTTAHPIEFGLVCTMVLPLALHYGFQARRRSRPAWGWWICAVLLGAGLMFAVSRSAVLGLAGVGVVLLAGWPARRRLGALVVSLVFLGVTKVVAPGLLTTLFSLFANASSDSSISYRTHRYPLIAHEIGKHLLLGRGLGTWYLPKYFAFDNQYLLTLVETGVVGLLAFAGLFLAALWASVRARYLTSDRSSRDLALALIASLVVPVIGAATFDLLSFTTLTGLSFLLLGAAGSLLRSVAQETPLGWVGANPADRRTTTVTSGVASA